MIDSLEILGKVIYLYMIKHNHNLFWKIFNILTNLFYPFPKQTKKRRKINLLYKSEDNLKRCCQNIYLKPPGQSRAAQLCQQNYCTRKWLLIQYKTAVIVYSEDKNFPMISCQTAFYTWLVLSEINPSLDIDWAEDSTRRFFTDFIWKLLFMTVCFVLWCKGMLYAIFLHKYFCLCYVAFHITSILCYNK